VFRSQSVAEEAWTILVEEVANLVVTLNKMDEVRTEADVKIGNPPAI